MRAEEGIRFLHQMGEMRDVFRLYLQRSVTVGDDVQEVRNFFAGCQVDGAKKIPRR